MMKIAIAIMGVERTGKTRSIVKVKDRVLEKYPGVNIELSREDCTGDITFIGTVGNTKIGIESQGDPQSHLFESIPLFIEKNCHVIICAARTRGSTKELVEGLQNNGYSLIQLSNLTSDNIEHDYLNTLSSEFVFKMLLEIVDNGYLPSSVKDEVS